MTKEQLHYTRVIAEFMGYNTKGYWWHHPTPDLCEKLPSSINESIAKFHVSYDWLMISWVKFRDIPEWDFATKQRLFKYDSFCKKIRYAITQEEIEVAFEELGKAIEWYNGLKK